MLSSVGIQGLCCYHLLAYKDCAVIICWHKRTVLLSSVGIQGLCCYHLLAYKDCAVIICWHTRTVLLSSVGIQGLCYYHLLAYKDCAVIICWHTRTVLLSSVGIQGLCCLCLLFYEISCKKDWLLQCVVYCGGDLVLKSWTSEHTDWWKRKWVGDSSHLWYPLTAECVKFIICSVTVLVQICRVCCVSGRG